VRDKPRVIGAVPYLPSAIDLPLIGGFIGGIVFVVGVEMYATRRRSAEDAAKPTDADSVKSNKELSA
jgi:hypothetical protein